MKKELLPAAGKKTSPEELLPEPPVLPEVTEPSTTLILETAVSELVFCRVKSRVNDCPALMVSVSVE